MYIKYYSNYKITETFTLNPAGNKENNNFAYFLINASFETTA